MKIVKAVLYSGIFQMPKFASVSNKHIFDPNTYIDG